MKTLLFLVLLILLVLAGPIHQSWSQLRKPPEIHEFKTPSGVSCVMVTHDGLAALSCEHPVNFKKESNRAPVPFV